MGSARHRKLRTRPIKSLTLISTRFSLTLPIHLFCPPPLLLIHKIDTRILNILSHAISLLSDEYRAFFIKSDFIFGNPGKPANEERLTSDPVKRSYHEDIFVVIGIGNKEK